MQRTELPQNLDDVIYFHHYFYPYWIQTDFLVKDIKPWSSFIQAASPTCESFSHTAVFCKGHHSLAQLSDPWTIHAQLHKETRGPFIGLILPNDWLLCCRQNSIRRACKISLCACQHPAQGSWFGCLLTEQLTDNRCIQPRKHLRSTVQEWGRYPNKISLKGLDLQDNYKFPSLPTKLQHYPYKKSFIHDILLACL